MAENVAALQRLGAEAERLDRAAGQDPGEDRARAEALTLLEESIRALGVAVSGLDTRGADYDTRAAWSALEGVFDVAGGRDLRVLLDESIVRETVSLRRERAAADASLTNAKAMALVTSGLLVALAMGLAWLFAGALRRPLAELRVGARALTGGNLAYRMPEAGRNEFAQFARAVNHMAGELLDYRNQEAGRRLQLEAMVAERTGELDATLSALRHSEARRRQLLGEIGHELRTPTTAIRGEAEITLRGGEKPVEEYRAALSRISLTARQLGVLIDDLLTVARSDVDALSVDLQPVPVQTPLREALVHASGLAAHRRIAFEVTGEEVAATILADPQRLQQLITLIVDNAVRYSHEGGTIAIDADVTEDADGRAWRLRVADRGIGIHAEDLPRVFERDFRGRGARSHRPDGTGLGLAIARTLVDRHGGRIDIASEPGAGTTVTLTLPLHDDTP
jgi:signal transduction histidine kinase